MWPGAWWDPTAQALGCEWGHSCPRETCWSLAAVLTGTFLCRGLSLPGLLSPGVGRLLGLVAALTTEAVLSDGRG